MEDGNSLDPLADGQHECTQHGRRQDNAQVLEEHRPGVIHVGQQPPEQDEKQQGQASGQESNELCIVLQCTFSSVCASG